MDFETLIAEGRGQILEVFGVFEEIALPAAERCLRCLHVRKSLEVPVDQAPHVVATHELSRRLDLEQLPRVMDVVQAMITGSGQRGTVSPAGADQTAEQLQGMAARARERAAEQNDRTRTEGA